MKKLLGVILLILGLIAGIKAGVKLSSGTDSRGARSSSYAAGRTVGTVLAPVILLGLGFWLVNRD